MQDLVVTGDRRFQRAVDALLGIEGGHANDPADRGGETKYGISLRFLKAEGRFDLDADGYADLDLDFDGDLDGADIRALTVDDAIRLYRTCFWDALDCASFPRPLGEAIFDQAVNGGALAARKLLQIALNFVSAAGPELKVDGMIGPATRARLVRLVENTEVGLMNVVGAYRVAAGDRYRRIVARDPSQRRFLKGWLRRADALGKI